MFSRKMGQRATWDDPGGPTMPPHLVWAWPGSWPRLDMVWGPPGPSLTLPPTTASSLPAKLFHLAQSRVLAVLPRKFRSPCSAHPFC